MSLRLIRSIRLRFGAVKLLSGDGDHRPYRVSSLNIRNLLRSDAQNWSTNRGRDEPPAHPIDSFSIRGSKIAIGRWRPSPLPGFKLEHLDLRLDLIPKTGQPNRGRDDRLGRPIDSFTARGSKISIGRWGPSPLPGFKPEHLSIPSPENAGQTLGLFGWPADASHQNWSNLPS